MSYKGEIGKPWGITSLLAIFRPLRQLCNYTLKLEGLVSTTFPESMTSRSHYMRSMCPNLLPMMKTV